MDVTPIAGTLPVPFCHRTWQETYEQMMAVTRVQLPDSLGQFTVGPTPPGPNDRDKLWFNTTQYRWYWPDTNTSKWISPHPIPPLSPIVEMWNDTDVALLTYEGGSAGAATPTNGPFWEIFAEFEGRSPIGKGKIGGAVDGTDLALAANHGSEFQTGVMDHKHGFGCSFANLNGDKGDSVGTMRAASDVGYLRREADASAVTVTAYRGYMNDQNDDDAAEPGYFPTVTKADYITTSPVLPDSSGVKTSIVHPVRSIYFIRRTSRAFYSILF